MHGGGGPGRAQGGYHCWLRGLPPAGGDPSWLCLEAAARQAVFTRQQLYIVYTLLCLRKAAHVDAQALSP